MRNYLKISKTRQSSAGFTLPELLIAGLMTTITVGAAGWGLVNIIGANRTASAQTERRTELNRALDFMAEEVRQANTIKRDAPEALWARAPDFNSTGRTPVLVLEIPDVPQRVIYYIASPPKKSPWLGPKVLYRWGPNFQGNGTYNPDSLDDRNSDPEDWTYEPVVDLIEDDAQEAPAPTCPNGWSRNGVTGFYACVDPTGRIAEIYQTGRVYKARGVHESYQVSTKVFARNSGVAPHGGGGARAFNLSGGILSVNGPSTLKFRVLGSSITCPGGKPVVSITTRVERLDADGKILEEIPIDQSQPFDRNVEKGNKFRVVGTAHFSSVNCGSNLTYGSDSSQAIVLRDGERPAAGYTPFDNQTSIEDYTGKYINSDGTVQVGNDQAIYFFELGATDQNSAAFNMQDLVVLGDVDPR